MEENLKILIPLIFDVNNFHGIAIGGRGFVCVSKSMSNSNEDSIDGVPLDERLSARPQFEAHLRREWDSDRVALLCSAALVCRCYEWYIDLRHIFR